MIYLLNAGSNNKLTPSKALAVRLDGFVLLLEKFVL